MITTKSYKIESQAYLMILFKSFAGTLTLISILLCAIAFLSFLDYRYALVLLMVIFILLPMIIFYLYLWHGLKQETRLSILEKNVIIDEEGLNLKFEDEKEIKIIWDEFDCLLIKSKYLLFAFKKSRHLFFVIPYEAFNSTDDLRESMKIIPLPRK